MSVFASSVTLVAPHSQAGKPKDTTELVIENVANQFPLLGDHQSGLIGISATILGPTNGAV